MLLKGGGGSEQHKGPQSLFVEGLLEGGVRTTDGATVFVCRDRKKQRKGVADWLFQGGGVFLLEVQYSILKSLISTCVLSYVGSREDWLLDRICESKKDCWDSMRRTSYPYQQVER